MVDANPQAVEIAQMEGRLREALEQAEIPKADRELSYWQRICEMADDVRSHAASRLDATFAGGVKVSVYRMGDDQVRIDIKE